MRPSVAAALVSLAAACATPSVVGSPAARPGSATPESAPTVAADAGTAAPFPGEAPTVRLPEGVTPLDVALSVRVVPGEATTSGAATVHLSLAKRVDVVWLNARALTVTEASVAFDGRHLAARAVQANEHFLAVVPATPIGPGPATLTLAWTAPLSDKNESGLFQLEEGGERYAVTQFEPIDARRAWPCFDEPGFKVPWRLTLHVKREHQAFSNTPVEEETPEDGGMKAVTFARTKPLPSYLVALAVGPFEVVEAGVAGVGKTPVRIVVPRGKAAEAEYAKANTRRVLEALEAWFGGPYPYEKLDQLAMPMGFGAMEHPGLVTWGYRLLLEKPEQATVRHRRNFLDTCAHELAHMWFGDLVTMQWWDDIWLNESFATWMASKTVATLEPGWGVDVELVEERSGALQEDALATARRIRQPIESLDDVANAFDGITYGKGAAVLGMFEAALGPDAFQRAVRHHLAEHAFGNATARDFLGAVSAEAGHDVAPGFSTFLDQPGAPRVAFEVRCPKGAPPFVTLSQKRERHLGAGAMADLTWQLPVCVRYGTADAAAPKRQCTTLSSTTGHLPLEGKACPAWFLPNDGMHGYYRSLVQGSRDTTSLATTPGATLSVAERVGVVGDVAALVSQGELEVGDALAVVGPALAMKERHLTSAAASLATRLGQDVLPAQTRPTYAAWVRETFGPRLAEVGFSKKPGEAEDVALMRSTLLSVLGHDGEDPAVRSKCLALARAWLTDRKAIEPDLTGVVLGIAGATNDAALHAALLAAVKHEPDRADRGRMLRALGSATDAALVRGQLGLLFDDAIAPREASELLWAASGDYRTRDEALAFIHARYDEVVPRLPEDSAAYLPFLGAGACTPEAKEELRAFFEPRTTKVLGGPRALEQALESIDLCAVWRERHVESARKFLEAWRAKHSRRP